VTLAVQTILDELTQLHRERGNEATAATMTLVVFFEDAKIGALARDRIHALAAKYPSRVIVLDATAAETLQRVQQGDWIELGVKSADAELVRSAVAALRLHDAPVILLWIAPDIGDDDRFCELSSEARTIVYNSSLVHAGGESLGELAAYSQRHPELALADIAYLRLAPWQECVAIFFDGRVEELAEVRRVEIGCGSDPEGFYLLGWLASRLRWRPEGDGSLIDEAGNHIEFEVSREGEPRRIRRVSLESKHATFIAEVDGRGETISLSVTGGGAQPRYRAVNNPGIAALVERAILLGHNDRVFQEALATAGEILARRSPRA
jgi:glucose-6-phosphate dehydrogenase assembly protein OpcA